MMLTEKFTRYADSSKAPTNGLRNFWLRHMTNPKRPLKDTYIEEEAATALGIPIVRLHQILDQHIFTNGSIRPESIEFTSNDLLLVNFWNKNPSLPPPAPRILRMPKRR